MRQFDENKPIYIQIMDEIMRRISRGELKAGERVPSVRDFAREFGVNPNTVQRAYFELEREGILETKRGQGTFVTEDGERIKSLKEKLLKSIIDSFRNELESIGLSNEEILKILEELREALRSD